MDKYLLKNCNMAIAKIYFREMENISYHVTGRAYIYEKFLRCILRVILNMTYDKDEALKLEVFHTISIEVHFVNYNCMVTEKH